MDNPSVNYLFYCGLVFICLSLLFIFRESVHGLKERIKYQIREFLRPFFIKVNGDTVYTAKEGPMQFIWEYLDTYFLMPSEYVSVSDDEEMQDDEEDEDEDEDEDDEESVIEGMQDEDEDEDDEESVIEGMQDEEEDDEDEESVIEGMQDIADEDEIIIEGMKETISSSDV